MALMQKIIYRASSAKLLLFFLLFFTACEESRAGGKVGVFFETAEVGRSPIVQAELALSEGERNLGLMYRKTMLDEHGMLFIFPDNKPRSFWMKNTYLELDMIFLDSSMRVVSIIHRAAPLTQSSRPSEKPAKYVLEVNGGLAEKWRLSTASIMHSEKPLPEGN